MLDAILEGHKLAIRDEIIPNNIINKILFILNDIGK